MRWPLKVPERKAPLLEKLILDRTDFIDRNSSMITLRKRIFSINRIDFYECEDLEKDI